MLISILRALRHVRRIAIPFIFNSNKTMFLVHVFVQKHTLTRGIVQRGTRVARTTSALTQHWCLLPFRANKREQTAPNATIYDLYAVQMGVPVDQDVCDGIEWRRKLAIPRSDTDRARQLTRSYFRMHPFPDQSNDSFQLSTGCPVRTHRRPPTPFDPGRPTRRVRLSAGAPRRKTFSERVREREVLFQGRCSVTNLSTGGPRHARGRTTKRDATRTHDTLK